MRLLFSSAAAAAIALSAIAVSPVAFAANSHPRVQPVDCGAIAAKVGPGKVWQASFWAERGEDDEIDRHETIFVNPCFASQTNCVNWLYWAQSDWPNQHFVGRCKTGLPY